MGLIGGLPPAAKLTATIDTVADASAQATPGQLCYSKTSGDKWSLYRYYKAAATILKGKGLVVDMAAADPNTLITGATTDVNSYAARGVAAANVSNTGYYSWAVIGGYAPDVRFNSGYASGIFFGLSGSQAGDWGSAASAGSTIAVNTKPFFFPVMSLDAGHADGGSTNSGLISPVMW